MDTSSRHPDYLTVAALAVLAMCLVTINHEAIGHGSFCLASGGRITVLTSSVFHCEPSQWPIAAGGPVINLVGGVIAFGIRSVLPAEKIRLRLFLGLVAIFSGFWEGGYMAQAMATRHGDLYYVGDGLFGEPDLGWRVFGVGIGIAIFLMTWAYSRCALSQVSCHVIRLIWLSATLAAIGAALFCQTNRWADVQDAFMEFGAASAPLLFLRRKPNDSRPTITRSLPAIWLAFGSYIAFIATLGWGIRLP